ncbi:MAG: TauD/TfdA dioxygenase family protein [Burkholderiales bacterium]
MATHQADLTDASVTRSAPRFRALSPNIGIEVEGVDLRQPLDDEAFRSVEAAWHANCIILFRGQSLDEDQQVAFASRFGPLAQVLNKHGGASTHHPGVMFISNIRENGKLIGALPDGEMMFHSDQCYIERPCYATLLYAIEIPRQGGNTLFANMYKAYEALPSDLKDRLQGMQALHVYDYGAAPTQKGAVGEDARRFAHPIFRTHPATGKKALYVNRLMTDHIVGMDRPESDRTLSMLFDSIENPAWIYEHQWRIGDLLMWDNRCTTHARTDFDASERRLLRRCVVLGEKPY